MLLRPLLWAALVVCLGCGGSSKPVPTPSPGQDGGAQDAVRDVSVQADSSSTDTRGQDGSPGDQDAAADQTGGEAGGDLAVDTQAPSKPAFIIDDMERADMAARFVSPAGVIGTWSAVANFAVGQRPLPSASAIIRRIETPRGNSERAAMLVAPVLEDGSDLFIDLRPLTGTTQHVDFSRYTGIAFWSRVVLPPGGAFRPLVVAIKDDRYPVNDEEFWAAEFSAKPWFSVVEPAQPVWQRHELRFDRFRQGAAAVGGSGPERVRPNAIASIHFISGVLAPFPPSIELWIDDLVLTCNGPCPGETPSPPPVCTPGADQTCNDNPIISSLHGMCTPSGTCVCRPEYAKNPATGKCL
jgi:hypothetical protein